MAQLDSRCRKLKRQEREGKYRGKARKREREVEREGG